MVFGKLFKRRSEFDKYKEQLSNSSPRERRALYKSRESYLDSKARSRASNLTKQRTKGFNLFSELAKTRQRQVAYGRDVRRPLVGSGVRKQGRGRPRGASGKYIIPGVGAVGVYEYRQYLRQKFALERLRAQGQGQQAIVMQARERAMQKYDEQPEQRTVPDTKGSFNLKTIHKEAEDYANLFP